MRWLKKAQAGAAVLLVLIALIIILYVLFLPPDDRAALLGEDGVSTGQPGVRPQPPQNSVPNRLFTAVPNFYEPPPPEFQSLPAFTVRTRTAGDILAARNRVVVERSAFHSNDDTMSFTVPENADNLLLTFGIEQAAGSLQIDVNDNRVYQAPITTRQGPPIRIPVETLGPLNEITFSTSPVGFEIWKRHAYTLSNVKLTADVTTFEEADQTQRFVLRNVDQVERVQLSFVPQCFDQAGRLILEVNGDVVFSGRPDCGVDVSMDLALSRLLMDENVLAWSVNQGRYIIDDVELLIERTVPEQVETMVLSPEVLDAIVSQGEEVHLAISFAGRGAEGVIEINGEELGFRTHRESFAGPITPYLRTGANTMKIVSTTTPVTLLEVFHE